MAATGYTPIVLYNSPTASSIPLAANLAAGELALNNNIADGKLYYKDSAGNVQLLASKNLVAGGVTLNGVQTLTNKRIDPRVSTTASSASITPDVASFDQYCLTAQAAALAINAPTGTPVNGTKLIFRFLDNGTAQALTWNATYTVIGVTLPTTTTISKMLYVGCIYNAANTRWDVIAVTTQA